MLFRSPASKLWSGGNILLGGPGNDTFRITGGEDVIHGGAMLHTCLVAAPGGSRFTQGADTTCDGGPGFSSMTALNAPMNAGTLRPTDVRIVRELQFLSATDAAAAQDVLELNGVASDWVFSPISPLPAGATSAYLVTGPDGLRTTVYDVALPPYAPTFVHVPPSVDDCSTYDATDAVPESVGAVHESAADPLPRVAVSEPTRPGTPPIAKRRIID